MILKQRAALAASHVPSPPLIIPSPRGMPSRDSGLPLATRNTVGTSGNVIERLPAREGPSSTLFKRFQRIWHHLLVSKEILWNMKEV